MRKAVRTIHNFFLPSAPEVHVDPSALFEFHNGGKGKQNVHDVCFDDRAVWHFGGYGENFQGVYTNDIIVQAIAFAHQHRNPNHPIHIELRGELSRLLNHNKIVANHTQEQSILDACAEKGIPATDLQIGNIEKSYPLLFTTLRERGVQGLSTISTSLVHPLTVECIASYLFHAAQHDKDVLSLFGATRLSFHKTHGNEDGSYYALIEVAIRLHQFLQGKTLQCGIRGQIRYDKILGLLINGSDKGKHITDFPVLQELHAYITSHMPDRDFSRMYIAPGESFEKYKNEVLKKQIDAERILTAARKTRNIVLISASLVASALAGGIGGAQWYKDFQERQKTDQQNRAISSAAADIPIIYGLSGSLRSEVTDSVSKNNIIRTAAHTVYTFLINRYGINDVDPQTEDMLHFSIMEDLLDTSYNHIDINSITYNYDTQCEYAEKFLEQVYIPKHKLSLEGVHGELIPYRAFTQVIRHNTLKRSDSLQMIRAKASSTNGGSANGLMSSQPSTMVDHGIFISRHLGLQYEYYIVCIPIENCTGEDMTCDYETCVVARHSDYTNDNHKDIFDIQTGQLIVAEIQEFLDKKMRK